MACWVFTTLVLMAVAGKSLGKCPDYETASCELWSANATWPNNQVPSEDETVKIDKCILLDVSTASLGGLVISPGGTLVFSPSSEETLTLESRYIRVEGLLRVGSQHCRFEGKAHIVLTGEPGEHVDPEFGEKFIGVASGGELELHGVKKTSWTKLNMTLNKLDNTTGLYFDSKISKTGETYKQGIMASVINPATGVVRFSDVFFIGVDNSYWFNKDSSRFIQMMKWVPPGHVITMASQKNAIAPNMNATLIYEALEKAVYCKAGKSRLRNLKPGQTWAMVAVKEQPWRTIERIGKVPDGDGYRYAAVHLSMPLTNAAFQAYSKFHMSRGYDYDVRIIAATYDAGVPIVDMAGDVSSWKPGDEVVITSTDYDWKQATIGRVEKCPINLRNITCNNNQIRINVMRRYMHWGEITHSVDMRAEVGLLSHNVVVYSRDVSPKCYDNLGNETTCTTVEYHFGGHIKIKEGFKAAHIEGVRLIHMGQDNNEGAYPIFFDMVGEVNDTAFFRGNSIVESFRRCVVLRGTHFLRVENNVAYRHAGHCFHLVEGGEKFNVINGNLGVGTLNIDRTQIEKREAATFFIANPLTVFTNNVAAGGDSRGIQYAFPKEPVGLSRGLGLMERDEARRTPFLDFDNNVAHSYFYHGVDMVRCLADNGASLCWNSGFEFKSNPLDKDSEDVPSYVKRATLYKNRHDNIFARGGWLVYDQASLSDSIRGIYVGQSSYQRAHIVNSVILGDSANIGEPGTYWNGSMHVPVPRSIPMSWSGHSPRQGIAFSDGPLYVDNVFFDNFVSNEIYSAGALGFIRNNRWWTSPLTAVSNATWGFEDGSATGNRVFGGDETIHGFNNLTGDIQALFRDLDGSVTGYPDSAVVKPYPFIYTDECFYKENWMMYACPYRYGKISLSARKEIRETTTPFMTRDDVPVESFVQDWTTTANFPVILGGDYSYILHFDNELPQEMWLTGDGIEKDLWVRVGICLPLDAEFELYTNSPEYRPELAKWDEVGSIEELDAVEMAASYYWDNVTGIVFLKFMSYLVREPNEKFQCPSNKCPRVRLIINGGDVKDSNCLDRAYPSYTRSSPARKRSDEAMLAMAMPPSSSEPGQGVGADKTYPFVGAEVLEGSGFREWSLWSACSQTCGGGMRTRQRPCDDLEGCVGPSVESEACEEDECPPESGEYSQWTQWSECSESCAGGLQSRSRECVNDTVCDSDLQQEKDCNIHECEIDGGFSDWTNWSTCTVTCGGGMRSRSRACDNPKPEHGGDLCDGATNEEEDCNVQECPIDGGFSDWTEWSECSVTCGGGESVRERKCDNPKPEHGGADCDGELSESVECGTEDCPIEIPCVTQPAQKTETLH